MPLKPVGTLTANVAHPVCPSFACTAHEGSGLPHNIGKEVTSLATNGTQLAGTTAWAFRAGFGNVLALDGIARIGYGTGTFLSGRSKFTVGVAFNPSRWDQTGAFFSKQAAYLSSDYYSVGLTNDSGFGPIFYFLLGNAGGNGISVEYFVQTGTLALGMQTWFIDFDNSRGANDQMRFYLGSTQQGTTIRANLGATTVASPSGQVIEIGQGTGSFDAPLRTLGPVGQTTDLGWLYVWDNQILTAQQKADLITNPYVWTNEAKPVVTFSIAAASAYEKTPSQIPKRGTLTLARVAGDISAPLAIPVTIGGTAIAGIDYTALSTPQTIPGGALSLDIPVTPILNASAFDFSKSVTLTIPTNAAYEIATAVGVATVTEFELDVDGGLAGLPSPNVGLNGKWRVELVNGTRLLPVSPAGNYTYLLQCQICDPPRAASNGYLNNYYGTGGVPFDTSFTPWTQWVTHCIARLKDWGFNVIGEKSSPNFWPVNTNFVAPKQTSLAYCYLMDVGHYGNGRGIANVYSGVNHAAVSGAIIGNGVYSGELTDVFDSRWPAFVTEIVTDNRADIGPVVTGPAGLINAPANQRRLVYVSADDSDFMRGMKFESQEHIGYLSAIVNSTLPSKLALRDWLQNVRYPSLAAFNASWTNSGALGAGYTTFGSAGGWPKLSTAGTGFLDEDGSSLWLKGNTGFYNTYWLSDFPPNVKTDLDAFMVLWLARYYQTIKTAMNTELPGTLICSNDGIGIFGSGTKPLLEQMWAAFVDVIVTSGNYPLELVQLISQQYTAIPKPMLVYLVVEAMLDSPNVASANDPAGNWDLQHNVPAGNWNTTTQALRGQLYKSNLAAFWSARTAGGIYPIIGIDWWRLVEGTGGEPANFGLITEFNNAFDGVHATTSPGTSDAYGSGYTPTAEAANYGDAITGIRDGNYQMLYNVMQFVSGIVPVSQPSQEALPAGSGAGFS